jgi:RNA polymerase sigma-70 factor, ECF subfamily
MALTKDPNQAEDLFQETCLVIIEKSGEYEPGTDFLAWALKIAKFKFLASVDPQRQRHVLVEAAVLENALATPDPTPGTDADRREALALCMEQLASAARQVLELRYGQGLPVTQIAGRMNLTSNALYVMLSRVRQALQDCVTHRLRAGEA